MIWFLVGYFVALFLRASVDASNEKNAVKNRLIKLEDKYYKLIPFEED